MLNDKANDEEEDMQYNIESFEHKCLLCYAVLLSGWVTRAFLTSQFSFCVVRGVGTCRFRR